MEYGMSFSFQRGATVLHNVRAGATIRNKNIDWSRTKDNRVFETIYEGVRSQKQVNERRREFLENNEIMKKAIEDFNKGKKPSRQTTIEKELEKIKVNKDRQRVKLYEERSMIIQIGKEEINPKDLGDQEAVNKAYERFYKMFSELPGIYITDARVHNDETTPHLNISFYVLQEKENKKGINVNSSFHDWMTSKMKDFKGFRNAIFLNMEKAAEREGIKAKYKPAEQKQEPIRDPEEFKQKMEQFNQEKQNEIDKWEQDFLRRMS